jgi:hypothetical protein
MDERIAEVESSLLKAIRVEGSPFNFSPDGLKESEKKFDALLEGSAFEDRVYEGQAAAVKDGYVNLTY